MMQGKDLVLWNLLTVNIYMQLLQTRPEIAIKLNLRTENVEFKC